MLRWIVANCGGIEVQELANRNTNYSVQCVLGLEMVMGHHHKTSHPLSMFRLRPRGNSCSLPGEGANGPP